jgi:hypothetical protein
MHACQHLKSGKVKKHVKRDPTKGPIGAKSTKTGQKLTKSGQRVPQKQAKLKKTAKMKKWMKIEEEVKGERGARFARSGEI